MMLEIRKSLYEKPKPSLLVRILNIILAVLATVLIVELFFGSMYTGVYVVGESMAPTLTGAEDQFTAGGDYVYMREGAQPDYNDIVVVYWSRLGSGMDKNIIKRAVAFGGDTVEIINGVLYVNGNKVDEPYVSAEMNTSASAYYNYGPHTVAEGKMFLLGDNRDGSNDSRQNGDFSVEDVLGVVPQWSVNCKGMTTAWHTFFRFTLSG